MPADKKTKVMIVDDHPMVREGLEAMLVAAGFTVVGNVESGEQALAQRSSRMSLSWTSACPAARTDSTRSRR